MMAIVAGLFIGFRIADYLTESKSIKEMQKFREHIEEQPQEIINISEKDRLVQMVGSDYLNNPHHTIAVTRDHPAGIVGSDLKPIQIIDSIHYPKKVKERLDARTQRINSWNINRGFA